ncbi:MLO-like protein 3 [Hibiscus syriacus]|uniref:MLO-like protein 3 n=1 Tax=Hibiscus syriacus TaxID=106335 RepID=A0A6A3CRJ4_HIBSY|nr:MLO-like protein 3 [Hibiscus syriacus]
MAAGKEASTTRSLEETPTWAVAAVCFFIVSLSVLIEYLIHLISNCLKRRRKTALYDAVDKLKSVLMVLGFMSLTLTVTRSFISRICIPNEFADSMLPCRKNLKSIKAKKDFVYEQIWSVDALHERILAGDSKSSDYCESKGKKSLISEEGGNQLSIFLFALAAMQIVYSVLTMALTRAKMRRWKAWEKETQTVEYQVANELLLPTVLQFGGQN